MTFSRLLLRSTFHSRFIFDSFQTSTGEEELSKMVQEEEENHSEDPFVQLSIHDENLSPKNVYSWKSRILLFLISFFNTDFKGSQSIRNRTHDTDKKYPRISIEISIPQTMDWRRTHHLPQCRTKLWHNASSNFYSWQMFHAEMERKLQYRIIWYIRYGLEYRNTLFLSAAWQTSLQWEYSVGKKYKHHSVRRHRLNLRRRKNIHNTKKNKYT